MASDPLQDPRSATQPVHHQQTNVGVATGTQMAFEVIQYGPIDYDASKHKASDSPKRKAAPKCHFHIPEKNEEWTDKRTALGLNTSEGARLIFDKILLKSIFDKDTRKRPKITELNFHLFLTDFGRAAIQASCSEPECGIYNFRLLVFLGLCQVAWKLNEQRDEVDHAMRSTLRLRHMGTRPVNDLTLRRYRYTVSRVIKYIDELSRSSMGYRAFELPIYCTRSLRL